jgi:hypothetical protein
MPDASTLMRAKSPGDAVSVRVGCRLCKEMHIAEG